MANNLSAFTPKYWSKRMQIIHEKATVYRAICSFEERATLNNGDTVARPYRSALVAQTYTKATDVSLQDITATEETLVVNVAKTVPFYVDDIDKIQNKWDSADAWATDAGKKLYQWVDADVLGEYDQAASTVDDADFAGTSGLGITVDVTNILQVFTRAGKKLDAQNIDSDNRFAVISPQVKQVLLEYLGGKESALGDSTGMNGHIGRWNGFELYVSNNLTFSANLNIATQPTNTDTVVINGVTFTFVTSIGSTAGNVLIGADAAAARTNLIAAINDPATTSSTQVALSAANQLKLRGMTASESGTTVLIKCEGFSYLANGGTTLAETLTAAADIWTTTKQIQHNLFGRKGAIDVVIQKEPNVEFRMPPLKLGRNVLPWVLYGLKTFKEGTYALVDVRVRTDAF